MRQDGSDFDFDDYDNETLWKIGYESAVLLFSARIGFLNRQNKFLLEFARRSKEILSYEGIDWYDFCSLNVEFQESETYKQVEKLLGENE